MEKEVALLLFSWYVPFACTVAAFSCKAVVPFFGLLPVRVTAWALPFLLTICTSSRIREHGVFKRDLELID